MPNAPRCPDGVEQQEWATDTSNSGKPSGNIALEVVFANDDPDGEWTTHTYDIGYPEMRLGREKHTAITIEGLNRERERALTALLHGEHPARKARSRILALLNTDPNLRWVR